MVEVKLNSSQKSGLVRGGILHSGVGDHILYGRDLQGIDVLNAVTYYDLGVCVIDWSGSILMSVFRMKRIVLLSSPVAQW